MLNLKTSIHENAPHLYYAKTLLFSQMPKMRVEGSSAYP